MVPISISSAVSLGDLLGLPMKDNSKVHQEHKIQGRDSLSVVSITGIQKKHTHPRSFCFKIGSCSVSPMWMIAEG